MEEHLSRLEVILGNSDTKTFEKMGCDLIWEEKGRNTLQALWSFFRRFFQKPMLLWKSPLLCLILSGKKKTKTEHPIEGTMSEYIFSTLRIT